MYWIVLCWEIIEEKSAKHLVGSSHTPYCTHNPAIPT